MNKGFVQIKLVPSVANVLDIASAGGRAEKANTGRLSLCDGHTIEAVCPAICNVPLITEKSTARFAFETNCPQGPIKEGAA